MIAVKINVPPVLAEYARGRYGDDEGVVKFPAKADIYHTLYDLMQRRPDGAGPDRGNLTIALPDRREGNMAAGKNPETYNWLSERSAHVIATRLKVMMWADLHDFMDENKHLRGVQFKESVYLFLTRYGIESISDDALLKNYQRWRQNMRRRNKRQYKKNTDRV